MTVGVGTGAGWGVALAEVVKAAGWVEGTAPAGVVRAEEALAEAGRRTMARRWRERSSPVPR